MTVVGALLAIAAAAFAYPSVASHLSSEVEGHSTLEKTILGTDQDSVNDRSPSNEFTFLRTGPGERYVVREDLGTARPGRAERRRSLIYLTQLTDFQLVDEESPARVEFLDHFGGEVSAAWRPQEALVPHEVEWTIRQVNRFVRSPVRQGNGRRARMENAVLTGDLADNQHRNETKWVVQLLEGGQYVDGELRSRELHPNSGRSNMKYYSAECKAAVDAEELNPREARRYTGVQDYEDYPPGDPHFYDPEQPDDEYQEGGWPRYEGLLDRAQRPFRVRGLKVPSYVAFGNHDGLAQGNEDAIRPYEDVGTGCVKVFPPVASSTADFGAGLRKISRLLEGSDLPGPAQFVPPDERRQYVDQRQFKRLHDTGKQPDEHGFTYVDRRQARRSLGDASYYSFTPPTGAREVRYIVLDTLSDGGVVSESSNGNIDDPQWRWLKRELRRASRRDKLIMVFAHHATGSLSSDIPDEAAPPCTKGDGHGHDIHPGCDRDPRSSTPLHFGDDLKRLFHRFPQVIAYVAGHSHENEIQSFKDGDGGGFWEIKSPAVIDWPPQHRLIEVMDNRDGTLSIFGTLLDHAAEVGAPAGSGPAGEASVSAVGGFDSETLASIGRTLAYNDPQEGPDGSQGKRKDRNVELLLRDPRRPERGGGGDDGQDGDGSGGGGTAGGATPGGGTVRGGAGEGGTGSGGAAGVSATASLGGGAGAGGGSLPFTGLALGLLALIGAALAVAGRTLRRRAA